MHNIGGDRELDEWAGIMEKWEWEMGNLLMKPHLSVGFKCALHSYFLAIIEYLISLIRLQKLTCRLTAKANGRDFWFLAKKTKQRPKAKAGGGTGAGTDRPKANVGCDPRRNDLKIQDWEQELNFLSAFMCQSRPPLSSNPLSPSLFLSLSATAIGIAYNDEQARPFGPFALLYYTRIIFKSQLGIPPPPYPFSPCRVKGLEKQFWKFIFINFNSLQKFCVFPLFLRHFYISDTDIAQRVQRVAAEGGEGGEGGVRHSWGPNNYFFRFGQLVPF